jgi:hypothetical protein
MQYFEIDPINVTSNFVFFAFTPEQMKYWFIAEKVEEVASGIIGGPRINNGPSVWLSAV